jgi:hypothetical protein
VTAAARAEEEIGLWVQIASDCRAVVAFGVDPQPTELACTGHDPTRDLDRRAAKWQHRFDGHALDELARFAAGLATLEAERWAIDDAVAATAAHEARRFLLGDRMIHWAVPWADMAGRCHHPVRTEAHRLRDLLLDLGDRTRIAPLLTGDEGLHPPGEDSIGPELDGPLERIGRLATGTVLFRATLRSLTAGAVSDPTPSVGDLTAANREDLAMLYTVAAARWTQTAKRHPGTARLWRDLSLRCEYTAAALGEDLEIGGRPATITP